jgi:hypothetical protein
MAQVHTEVSACGTSPHVRQDCAVWGGIQSAISALVERILWPGLNGLTGDGLPSGLQLIGRPYDEGTVLRIGWAYEQATEWHNRMPSGLLN